MQANIRSILSKAKFELGLNPKIVKNDAERNYIPKDYKAVCTITADFELAWAPRYTNKVKDSYNHAIKLAKRERRNVPLILELCEQYSIPITWATVGHLFLDSCSPSNGKKHPEIPKVPTYEGKYWNYSGEDWFEYDPCTNIKEDPEWYGLDLVEKILDASFPQEIGCHTFSHIDCRDGICPPDLFHSEISLCQALAKDKSILLKSFVHPGHTIGNLQILERLGFTSFQTDPGNILGYPIKHQGELWELQRSMALDYRPQWNSNYHTYRFKKIIDRTLKHGVVCNFWFHPSIPELIVDAVFPDLFKHIDGLRDDLWIGTVSDYVSILNSN